MHGDNKKKILLVEDEVILAMTEKMALEKHGYNVIVVNSGEKAVEMINCTPEIQLILMDIDLGKGIDGTEAATTILKDHNIPVIFCTSHIEPEIVEKTEKITSYGYVVKNLSITVLDASIKMAFKLFDAIRQEKEKEVALQESKRKSDLLLNVAAEIIISLDEQGNITLLNERGHIILGYESQTLLGKNWFDTCLPEENVLGVREYFEQLKKNNPEIIASYENEVITKNGEYKTIHWQNAILKNPEGKFFGLLSSGEDITERKKAEIQLQKTRKELASANEVLQQKNEEHSALNEELQASMKELQAAEEELKSIEWLLTSKLQVHDAKKTDYIPPYGDLIALNTSRLILDSVGEQTLNDIASDYLNLLDTSSAVYEKNGDYALGIFSSGWCRYMDAASRALCLTGDNREALDCGKWYCHESCWSRASKTAIETGLPVDIECDGGIRLYAMPIRLGDENIGAINFGYGDPPRDENKLRSLADKYQVSFDEMREIAMSYKTRPSYIIDLAKQRLASSAHLIGDITARKQAEAEIKALLAEKELILKEVNHRVKNNMNSMKGLLLLQARTMSEVSAVTALEDASKRMQSMEILYDQLYQSASFSELSIKSYLSPLVDAVIANSPDGNLVKVEKRIDDFILNAKRLQPIGIIINELLTNIMKYAFKDKSKGIITVTATLEEAYIILSVHDNGKGIPESVNFEHSTGFGLMLVYELAGQLDGKIRIERIGGTRIVLEFER